MIHRAVQLIQIFLAGPATGPRVDHGGTRGPRGPKKNLPSCGVWLFQRTSILMFLLKFIAWIVIWFLPVIMYFWLWTVFHELFISGVVLYLCDCIFPFAHLCQCVCTGIRSCFYNSWVLADEYLCVFVFCCLSQCDNIVSSCCRPPAARAPSKRWASPAPAPPPACTQETASPLPSSTPGGEFSTLHWRQISQKKLNPVHHKVLNCSPFEEAYVI